MRIAVIGGGPGGLFFAVLMKRADRRHQITVFERNAPDATFGFGVVFPERSMRYLREADPDVHQAFIDATVNWGAIEYRYRGRVLRCGGHAFFGIARMGLLDILHRQARRLAVDLRFLTEIANLSALTEYDLVVAADGVNSLARSVLAEHVHPTIEVGRSKYTWLGTTRAFDALTFIFEESAHGWFGAHIYPYGPDASTFIVETDETTWRKAGLDNRETLEYCERLFARHLDGHRLLENNSRWVNFRTVRNQAWHAGHVVFLGDAAHTAHFSVGSGTRMALEDAIALAGALTHRTELLSALQVYEQDRRPAVRYIQRAAEPSRRWWERFRQWTHFAPEQFAFHHLARTRVLTYGTLSIRDRGFVRSAEQWFARSAAASGAGENLAAPGVGESDPIPPALAPLRLREVLLSNRIVVELPPAARTRIRRAGPQDLASLMQSSFADAGLIIVDPDALTAAESNNPRAGTPRTWEEESATAWIKAIASLRTLTATRIGLRLALTKPESRQFEHEVGGYARVARYAAEAHIDLLEIDSADVPAEDPVALDLLAGARSLWPAGRPISVRLAAWSDPENDQAVKAGLQYAEALKAGGCDVLAVAMPPASARLDSERARVTHAFTSDLIRNAVGLPTMLIGGTHTVGDVNTLILSGQADLCEWPRLAWPGWRPQPGQPVPR